MHGTASCIAHGSALFNFGGLRRSSSSGCSGRNTCQRLCALHSVCLVALVSSAMSCLYRFVCARVLGLLWLGVGWVGFGFGVRISCGYSCDLHVRGGLAFPHHVSMM